MHTGVTHGSPPPVKGVNVTARCTGCRAEVIAGRDDLGRDVTLDPTVLDPEGELEAILDGRRTYTLHALTGSIGHRDAWRIKVRPAGTRARQTVHPAHRCEDETP